MWTVKSPEEETFLACAGTARKPVWPEQSQPGSGVVRQQRNRSEKFGRDPGGAGHTGPVWRFT